MRKFFPRGMVAMAGLVCLPVAITPGIGGGHMARPAAPDYGQDPRLRSLRSFFEELGCPAREYAHVFLEAADAYKLDWRLLPSLSWIESSGGKTAHNNNLFGWNSGRASFPTPATSIHRVGFSLTYSSPYKGKGLDGILQAYNPRAEYRELVKSVMRRIAPSE